MSSGRAAHKKAVKASYQGNVQTIYTHLEEIIKKILAHKTKWTNKCFFFFACSGRDDGRPRNLRPRLDGTMFHRIITA